VRGDVDFRERLISKPITVRAQPRVVFLGLPSAMLVHGVTHGVCETGAVLRGRLVGRAAFGGAATFTTMRRSASVLRGSTAAFVANV